MGQGIHGLCYAFYTSTCFIYANKVAPKDVGNSAQSIFNFIWYGLGPLLAVLLNGLLASRFASAGETLALEDFAGFWYSLAGIAGLGFVVFALFFREAVDGSAEETAVDGAVEG